MQSDALRSLRQDVEELAVGSERDLLEFLGRAARLASLGEDTFLRKWPQLAGSFSKRVGPVLIDRCRTGIHALHTTHGADLAQAIIAAQDFHCFYVRERDLIPREAHSHLEAWAEEAEAIGLDEDAVERLESFLEQFPISEDDRLAVVDSPLSEFAEAFLASQAQPRPTIDFRWRSAGVAMSKPDEVVAFADEKPSDRLKASFERLDNEVDVPGEGRLQISRRLLDEWAVSIDLSPLTKAMFEVESVRMGVLPAQCVEGTDLQQ